MVVPPGEVLDAARAAAKQGDYALALEKYERFFDRALLDQGEDNNYYGVRLSYCLSEWARLGNEYCPARKRLEEKAEEALVAFETTSDSEKFHDFQAISGKLGRMDEVLEQFVTYHESRPDLASAALRFMWNRLIEARRWDICAAHLDDPKLRYKRALGKFDEAMEICQGDPSLGGEEFADQIRGWYVRDFGNLL
jgi:tetratricopeptide (TPR) repeat protein